MSTHKYCDKICCVVFFLTLLLTILFANAECFGIQKASVTLGYETRLFDISYVHSIDIVMDDWEEFIANCQSEEYYSCAVVIDNEAYKNVAIRAKGNTSLTQVEAYGNDRYSFKIEFDHYDSTGSYYGLDKLCLNNMIQDNTYMKDYLTYQMMAQMGAAAPLCSYVNITVNGEDWGLYLAVEGVEESFLQRNYGSDYGELYKPDSMSMGAALDPGSVQFSGRRLPDSQMPGGQMPDGQMPGGQMPGDRMSDGQMPDGQTSGSDDVLLKYAGDEIDSYSNIFDNAKTNVSDSDKTRLIEALKKLNAGEDISDTVDVTAVIRYFVVHNFVLNFDSYTGSMIHNYYLYEKDGQLQMIPWDYNLAFGGFDSAGGAVNLINFPIDSPVSGGNVEDRPMLAWIFADEEYTELYHQYFAEFILEWFTDGSFEEMTDAVAAMIAPYVEKDPTKFCTYEEFKTGVSTLQEFCRLRAESIKGQLNGTIGSTATSQISDTLIDADGLQISDMGAMDNEMGAMGNEMGVMNNEMGGGQMPDENGGWGVREPGYNSAQPVQIEGSAANGIWLAAAVVILVLGIGFTLGFKRRKIL